MTIDFSAKFYEVKLIDGDYAHLRLLDASPDTNPEALEILVARALLPEMINEGSKLKYEMLQYEIVG